MKFKKSDILLPVEVAGALGWQSHRSHIKCSVMEDW